MSDTVVCINLEFFPILEFFPYGSPLDSVYARRASRWSAVRLPRSD